MAGGAAGNAHLVNGIAQPGRLFDHHRHGLFDLHGLHVDAGFGMIRISQGVIDAGGHIPLGAQPLQHGMVVRFITGGETARVKIDHQAVAFAAIVGR